MTGSGNPPRPGDVVPVPAALFGPLLERITDVQELRCALRTIFVLHRKGGRPATLTAQELATDPALSLGGAEAAERALEALAAHGLLLHGSSADDGTAGYCLDTPANRRALAAQEGSKRIARGTAIQDNEVMADAAASARPNLFQLYEDNIGVITPMAAERLKDLEAEYPQEWIADAFQQAVLGNIRNLRYIEATLQRWRDDGRGDGKSGGRAGAVRASEIVRWGTR